MAFQSMVKASRCRLADGLDRVRRHPGSISLLILSATAVCELEAQTVEAPPLRRSGTSETENSGRKAGEPGSREDDAACEEAHARIMDGCFPTEALGIGPGPAGRYLHSRWAEDWSFLLDPARRRTTAERLKVVPLSSDRSVYVVLDGQVRLRTNTNSSPDLVDGEGQQQFLLRTSAGLDLHLGRRVRTFVEVSNARTFGRNLPTPTGRLENDAVLQQAFIELNVAVAGGSAGVRAGRQDFGDGPPLLISTRDGSNLRVTQNGLRLWFNRAEARMQYFDFRPTTYGRGGFGDDAASPNERFRGVNASIVLEREEDGAGSLYLDPFLYRYDRDRSFGSARGRDRRATFGTRLWGRSGRLSIDWTIARQTGSFTSGAGQVPLSALAARFSQSLILAPTSLRPEAGFHVDYASGGGAFRSGATVRTFDPLFGIAPLYSQTFYLNASNLTILAPTFAVTPLPRVRMTGEYELLWRTSRGDAIYSAAGRPYPRTEAVSGSSVAHIPRLTVAWSATPRLQISLYAERLIAGPVLVRAGQTGNTYLGSVVNLRF